MENKKSETSSEESRALWETFCFTGKIGAYMAYRAVDSAAGRQTRS